jgi:hypothetical protein
MYPPPIHPIHPNLPPAHQPHRRPRHPPDPARGQLPPDTRHPAPRHTRRWPRGPPPPPHRRHGGRGTRAGRRRRGAEAVLTRRASSPWAPPLPMPERPLTEATAPPRRGSGPPVGACARCAPPHPPAPACLLHQTPSQRRTSRLPVATLAHPRWEARKRQTRAAVHPSGLPPSGRVCVGEIIAAHGCGGPHGGGSLERAPRSYAPHERPETQLTAAHAPLVIPQAGQRWAC